MITAATFDPTRLVSERDFSKTVIDLARATGWKVYHTWLSLHSEPGFPDLVLVRPPRVIFAELKSERGTLSEAQRDWLIALGECPNVLAAIWRPSDWDRIVLLLGAGVIE